MEQWKDITDYEGLYQVSDLGNIRNANSTLMKKTLDSYGYYTVTLYKNKVKKTFKVHRLVAQAFIEGYSINLQVNHKDEVKTNNTVSNLELCDNKYNCTYGSRTTKLAKPIVQESLEGEFIKEWKSSWEIQRVLGFHRAVISSCCKGFKRDGHSNITYPVHQAYGYKWHYKL